MGVGDIFKSRQLSRQFFFLDWTHNWPIQAYVSETCPCLDCMVSIQSPQVGQLVTFVLQTRVAGQGEQQAPVRGLLPWQRGGVLYDNLFQPAPACLRISQLCVKLELYEVPHVPRKGAMLMLEQVDQASLSQPLTLCVKEQGMMGLSFRSLLFTQFLRFLWTLIFWPN